MDKIIATYAALLTCMLTIAHADESNKPDPAKAPIAEKKNFTAKDAGRMEEEARKQWISGQQAKLVITSRDSGPFGLFQNPGQEPTNVITKKKNTDEFLNAVAAIEVNAVMSQDNKFIVGSRVFRKGDEFSMLRGDREFKTKILSVKTTNILFQDMDTGEMIKKNLMTLPKGMSRNSKIDAVEGVTPAGKKDKSPLTLE
ncbi:MAG: hypothetical protein ACPG32_06520 [Akkermansiaceae bacterium]